jgi:hypothetical protein
MTHRRPFDAEGHAHMTDPTGAVRRAMDRDIRRAITALTSWPRPDPVQRSAIAEHLSWMLEPVARQGASVASAAAGVSRRRDAIRPTVRIAMD